ncbi:metal ABC transporter permease [Peijinzhouia sedimentorum]
MSALLIILTAIVVSTSSGLLGSFLMLRRMSMVGDAISHAVLPGIVLAFLVSGSRDSVWMVLAAGLAGMLTTFLIEFFHHKGKLQTDASIGVTFTWLFAIGVILISVFAGQVDLDQECVLYGEIAYVPIDLWITTSGTIMGPRVLYTTSISLLLVVTFIILFYKELKITTFDPEFSKINGIRSQLVHYLLMGFVSLTTVTAFEAVGAILVVAFMVSAPVTAYLLTDKLKRLLWLTVLIGVVNSVLGYFLAVAIDGSIAGAIATVAGLTFAVVFVVSPYTSVFEKRKKRVQNNPQPIH